MKNISEKVKILDLPPERPAPNRIPESIYNEFTFNDKIPVRFLFDKQAESKIAHNTALDYEKTFKTFEDRTFKFANYLDEINQFYDAFDKYDLKGKTVLIWGLDDIGLEALSIWKGAEKVYVIDNNKPICEHEKIIVLSHEELEKAAIKTDFAISFSSFEHDGLGQLGHDGISVDAKADLLAMKKAKSFLKDDGLLFLGVPISKDCIVWNEQRIYGELRLPVLLHGYVCIDVFNDYGDITPDFPFDQPMGALPRPLLVLQNAQKNSILEKLEDELEKVSKELKKITEFSTDSSRSPRLIKRILELQIDYIKTPSSNWDYSASYTMKTSCRKIFKTLPISQAPFVKPAPNTIPEEKYNEFTLNGEMQVQYLYYNAGTSLAPHNTALDYEKAFRAFENKTFKYATYNDEINQFYDAFDKYDLKEKTVLVWGLAGINLEALAVWKEAERVYVVDYNKPTCEHERITVLSHEELEKAAIKTDFAISFSSFEHDGLGQYGDPINPIGDFLAMKKTKRFLKDDGLLFLGVPLSQDCIVWNAHRIYGELRLPLLLKGYTCIDVFNDYGDITPDFPFDLPISATPQPLLVLQNAQHDSILKKLESELEKVSKELEETSEISTNTTRSPRILRRILEMQIQHIKNPSTNA